SQSQIVAASYVLLCDPALAMDARRALQGSPGGVGRAPSPAGAASHPHITEVVNPTTVPTLGGAPKPYPTQAGPADANAAGETDVPALADGSVAPAPDTPAAPERKIDPRWTNPDGSPKYGAMRPTQPATPADPTGDSGAQATPAGEPASGAQENQP
ncbi:MAG: hypothetical protein LBB54_04255, partial [Cellulomonadaceae bacterium]|nr:hypothetical protein [Cellulomonadaceae bacterium]